jgi:hypothetical protein
VFCPEDVEEILVGKKKVEKQKKEKGLVVKYRKVEEKIKNVTPKNSW